MRRTQTVADGLGLFVQVEGSPFDPAGLRSTDQIRMACKDSGVRIPLAPRFHRSKACCDL